MKANCREIHSAVFLGLAIALLLVTIAGPCCAQADRPKTDVDLLESNAAFSDGPAKTAAANESRVPEPAASDPALPQASTLFSDSGWHLVIAPYLWLPGVHGTIGALDRDVSVRATPGELISNFRFGLMVLVEPRYGRLLLPVDMIWIRLGDDSALPFPNLPVTTANVKADAFILTPKVGWRVYEFGGLKIDALTGIRYWHLGQNLQFTPSRLGLSFSGSQNWVDPLVGGRIQMPLSSKLEVTALGDVGGWGTGSQMDYQIAGFLGYKIKPRWTIQAGYRYLDVDRRSGGAIFDMAFSGAVLGVSIDVR